MLLGPAHAGGVKNVVINAVTLDDSPTEVTSDDLTVFGFDKLGFFVNYDETEVGGGVSVEIDVEFSSDGTNWVDGSFYDLAGGATIQTSEVISADGDYFAWFGDTWTIPYIRITAAGTGVDTDDVAVISVTLVGHK
ncbi:MAG: hypothetical protein NG737_07620 [Omnitrophica bacterium]|nr:hypothetical protein [Candidatus Omnitrophota bacterium]